MMTAAGVAAASALIVFASLAMGDRTHTDARSQPAAREQQKQSTTVAPSSTTHSPDAATRSNTASADHTRQSSPTRNFVFFNLARSKRFQRVGQISVKLGRTDVRRGNYDLLLLVDGHVINQNRVKASQPIWITASGGAPFEIVVNRIARNRVWGYVGSPNGQLARQQVLASNH